MYTLSEVAGLMSRSRLQVQTDYLLKRFNLPDKFEPASEFSSFVYRVEVSNSKPSINLYIRMELVLDISEDLKSMGQLKADYKIKDKVAVTNFITYPIINDGKVEPAIINGNGELFAKGLAISEHGSDAKYLRASEIEMYDSQFEDLDFDTVAHKILRIGVMDLEEKSLTKVINHFSKPTVDKRDIEDQPFPEELVEKILSKYGVNHEGKYAPTSSSKYQKTGIVFKVAKFSSLPSVNEVIKRINQDKGFTSAMQFMAPAVKHIVSTPDENEQISRLSEIISIRDSIKKENEYRNDIVHALRAQNKVDENGVSGTVSYKGHMGENIANNYSVTVLNIS